MALNKTSLTQVLSLLIEKFPNQLPKKTISLEDLGRLIGQQDVIQYIAQHLEAVDRANNGKW